MENDWVKVYGSEMEHKVNIVKKILEDNSIPAVILNKKDSSYISIGEIELYVRNENANLAGFIIKENSL